MTPADEHETDLFVRALRDDLPSDAVEARMRARLAALGLVSAGALATKSALGAGLTGKATLTKAGVFADVVARFTGLSLGAKASVATVAGALVAGGPIWIASTSSEEPSRAAPAAASTGLPQQRTAPRERSRSERSQPSLGAPLSKDAVEQHTPNALSQEADTSPSEPARRVTSMRVQTPRPQAPSSSSLGLTASGRESEPLPSSAAALPEVQAGPTSVAPSAPGSSFGRMPTRTRLSEETALMDAAFAALRRGDRTAARRFVLEHARRFPNGELRSERERAESLLARP